MDVTRRRLLAGLATVSAASVCSPLLQTAAAELTGPARLYPPMDLSLFDTPVHRGAWELRVGYAAITWDGRDGEAIEQISAVGYSGIQLRANVLKEHPDPKTLEAALAQHKLIFVALSSGGTELDPAKEKAMLDEHTQHAKYLHAAGGKYLQVIGAGNPKGGVANWTAADYKRQGYLLTEVGKRAAEFGIQTGFHNHMNTIGQAPECDGRDHGGGRSEIREAGTGRGALPAGRRRPGGCGAQVPGRLLFMHLKDTKPSSAHGGYEFAELGQGRVDFKALLTALKETHFRGWGIVELDGERPGSTRTPEESARMSKQYLESLGVRV